MPEIDPAVLAALEHVQPVTLSDGTPFSGVLLTRAQAKAVFTALGAPRMSPERIAFERSQGARAARYSR